MSLRKNIGNGKFLSRLSRYEAYLIMQVSQNCKLSRSWQRPSFGFRRHHPHRFSRLDSRKNTRISSALIRVLAKKRLGVISQAVTPSFELPLVVVRFLNYSRQMTMMVSIEASEKFTFLLHWYLHINSTVEQKQSQQIGRYLNSTCTRPAMNANTHATSRLKCCKVGLVTNNIVY